MSIIPAFEADKAIQRLKHYLPAQAPLKDFVHHNTLHAFQHDKFEFAIRKASKIFGYKTSLSFSEYHELYNQMKIDHEILKQVIRKRKGRDSELEWLKKLLANSADQNYPSRIGHLRKRWKEIYHLDINTIVHSTLFRILNSYLDQGIAMISFPTYANGFLNSVRELERNSYVSLLKTKRGKALLFDTNCTIQSLLDIIVGNESLYETYLFDQQFAHPGWSGLVTVVESQPETLIDKRLITLEEMIKFELILEIDTLDFNLGKKWKPLGEIDHAKITNLFEPVELTESDELLNIWQEAYEWTYYDQVLAGIKLHGKSDKINALPSFQAFFCIDDRECSIRRYVEQNDPSCVTYGTPGHFGIDTYYQPKNAQFYTKVCPAPITPKHLIKEVSTRKNKESDVHFTKSTHSLFRGWIISQTLGFWSALKLMFNIFKPSLSPASSSSFRHMNELSTLIVENRSPDHKQDGLQIGYTIQEMTDRVEAVLKSTGAVKNFAPLVYMIGHGASSANNTHYAGYDCGACSGRPGSANARAFSHMANHSQVRAQLLKRGIKIPEETEFIGGLHDTTSDEFIFYDEELLSPKNSALHRLNLAIFSNALKLNAKERSRRFVSINSTKSMGKIHREVKARSMSLFEPRPELNHATNALCIIGRKHLHDRLFLDRRAFLNSYNYQHDKTGALLTNIVSAAAPVCGGINLEYYFSRTDSEKLGAGSKLPHNVMGLIGVANGFEGDLRPGLPTQMIELHDPIRLMMIIEQFPEVVLDSIRKSNALYEWFINEWVMLAVVHPENQEVYHFKDGLFIHYQPTAEVKALAGLADVLDIIESSEDNLPVFEINQP